MFFSLQFKLKPKRKDKEKLIELMRKQFSTIRVAYNMLNGRRDRVRNRLAPLSAGGRPNEGFFRTASLYPYSNL